MKRVLASLVMVSLALPASAAGSPPFPDMANSWVGYQDAVSYLVGKGSIEGYPDGTFGPKKTVNRAEFLKLVFRSRASTDPTSGDCFADVQADDWFAPYVCAAKRRGIVNGYKVGSRYLFKPDQPINFAEAVKMVLLAYGSEVEEGRGEKWYLPYAEELDRHEILASSSYIPSSPLTRERAADLIARFTRHNEERQLGNRSPGCGKDPVDPPLTLDVDGVGREFLLAKPRSVSADRPAPLIIAFHGRTNSAEEVRSYYGFERSASDYFVAYPKGLPNGSGFNWAMPNDSGTQLGDVAFFDALVKQLGESYCIDTDRVFVVGHSLGAWMASAVACARGGVVRGSAVVGGAVTLKNCLGPTAALIINNPKDASSPQKTAEAMRDVRVAVNHCSQTTQPAEPASLSCAQYEGCGANRVVFCPHTVDEDRKGNYYPHQWPEGTGKAILEFFGKL